MVGSLDEISPSTELVAFDTLLQDESLSEDVREIMRMNTNDFGVSLPEWSKIEGKFLGHARHEHTSSFSESRF